MRPFLGVFLELAALGIVLTIALSVVNLYPLSILALLLVQLLTTVLVHCPSHYFVGRALGIRFSRIRLGRSSAAKALPSPLKRVGSLLVVFTLSVDRESRRTAPPNRMRAMYLAGVSGSVGSTIVFALAVSAIGNYLAAFVTWLFALAYLASDVKLSPVSGDLMRARAATTGRL